MNPTFWLNVTNGALGLGVLAGVALVACGVYKDVAPHLKELLKEHKLAVFAREIPDQPWTTDETPV